MATTAPLYGPQAGSIPAIGSRVVRQLGEPEDIWPGTFVEWAPAVE